MLDDDGKRNRNPNLLPPLDITLPNANAITVDEEADTIAGLNAPISRFIDEPTPITEVESPIQTIGVENSKFFFPLYASEELGTNYKAATCNENQGEDVKMDNILIFADTTHGIDPQSKTAKQYNDDGYLIIPDKKTICIFDGVGTPGYGYIATNIAAYFMLKAIQDGMSHDDALKLADVAIKHFQKSSAKYSKISTAAMIATIDKENQSLKVSYSGDCQIFVLRNNVLIEAPLPHNMYHRKLQTEFGGDTLRMQTIIPPNVLAMYKKIIESCLGSLSAPDSHTMKVQPGDQIFMCSDGYTDSFDTNAAFISFFNKILAHCNNDYHRACIMLKEEIIKRMKKIPNEGDNLTYAAFEIPS